MADMTLDTVFPDMLKRIPYGQRITTALRQMARAAPHPMAAFQTHEEEGHERIEPLFPVFELIGERLRRKIEGIIADKEKIREKFKGSPALDAGLLAAGQRRREIRVTLEALRLPLPVRPQRSVGTVGTRVRPPSGLRPDTASDPNRRRLT